MATAPREYVLFKTDLFVYELRDEGIDWWWPGADCAGWIYARLFLRPGMDDSRGPVMEDWGGWYYAVALGEVTVEICQWSSLDYQNCWVLGLKAVKRRRWFRRADSTGLDTAKRRVGDAIDEILADPRFTRHEWFAENPLEMDSQVFADWR